MTLLDLPPLLRDEPAIASVLGRANAVLAVPEPARAITVAALTHLSSRSPILVAVPTTGDAERLVNDLTQFLGPDAVDLFPAWETLPFERVSPSVETMGRRLRTMWRLRQGDSTKVVVAPARALVQRLGPHVEDVEPLTITPGQQLDPEELVARLVADGYRREYQVEARGEVAVRGSIVDVYPSTADAPVRIDLWGDEVDRLTTFSVSDQRSRDDVESVELFPCRELLPTTAVRERAAALVASQPWGREQWERLAEGLTFDGMESWLPWLTQDEHVLLDLLAPDAQVVLVEPRRMRDRAADLLAEEADLAGVLAKTWDVGDDVELPRLHVVFDRLLAHTNAPVLTVTNVAEGPDIPTVEAMGWGPVVGDGSGLAETLKGRLAAGWKVVLAADGAGSAERLDQSFRDLGVAGARVVVAPLERGVTLPNVKLAVVAESDITGRRRAHRQARPRKRESAGFFEDLKPGSYVVHVTHGVGRYEGMVKRAIGGTERDYLLLAYRGGDKLYIPSDQIDTIRHYTGGETPTLHRLGGSDFAKAKARVKSAAQEIAQELVVLYQRRVNAEGVAFSEDTPWQHEMEESFPYKETPDQERAILEVKADMESEHPMDRLVCGDVGFGKTEVALRAVFKAVQDGYQAAVLVPTTLLASQHFQTFSDRFSGYPVRVEVLSRFLTNAQAKKVLQGVADGEVDVVVGTHRLLSEGVKFKKLGLLVVDEEQRFGVTHKEAMKQLKTNVDVLTLSATPIPRTLEMSLTGIRDLSLLNTPPVDRQPILTYVGEYDDRAVAEAMRRELLREGQVFFVHNRVADIEQTAAELRELVPEARIAVAHGQMDEGTLEKVVIDFWEGEFDVLVCTTIIESGIDMPTVNTLVVDRADRLGLGQLHQLRGRVGRAGSRAYAYLFHPRDHALSDDAYERLKTIGEATELGSGFKIAMRDLEIRGAGNLLGESQSGHIAAVGYDLYVQMVSEAVAELKGEPVREPAEVKLELPVDASLPVEYVTKEELRLEAYRRLAVVETVEQVDDIRREWEDRYGPVPEPAEALLRVARLRVECLRIGVREITVTANRTGPGWQARLSPIQLRASAAVRLRRLIKDALYKEEQGQLVVPIRKGNDVAEALILLLTELVPTEASSLAS
ncbi:MAG: transcription-repair coupling factor [Actinomycetia bacterium]|nr:transcription-repair coupling factor [Actinomycetes bacterium]